LGKRDTKNKTKATLYDELIKQIPMEMREILEEDIVKFKGWHFKQIAKYTDALDAAYERIWQLELKDKEEEDIEEFAIEETTQEEAKQISLSKEDEDETMPI
jgi:leucyl aminopeptidase (aminopeptidase T)